MCGGNLIKLATWTSHYILINISDSRNCIFMSAEIKPKIVERINIVGHAVVYMCVCLIPVFQNTLVHIMKIT